MFFFLLHIAILNSVAMSKKGVNLQLEFFYSSEA